MKACPICNTLFEPQVPHQEYDRLSCRRRAAMQRARLKDKGAQVVTKNTYGAADHCNVVLTTRKSLDDMAQVYLNNQLALPTHFYTPPPEGWEPPERVVFAFQAIEKFWLMCGQELMDRPRQSTAEPAYIPQPSIDAKGILDKHLGPKVDETPTEPDEDPITEAPATFRGV